MRGTASACVVVALAVWLVPALAHDAHGDFAFYDCEVGDSALGRFCLLRDGTARWREYRVDYGRSNLRYRLPYLNPNCIYKLMAVLYQTGRDTWRQRLSLDGVPAGEVTHRPLRPETVWVALPRELYSADCAVELDIAKLAGDYAAVAALKVYQFYPFREKGEVEGGGVASSPGSGQEPGLFLAPPEPAPFAASANISYHVPTPRHVALRVYDVQGRLVVTLASGLHAAGAYRVRWDGQSTSGARVAAGTYLVRLESESTSRTRKLVLTR